MKKGAAIFVFLAANILHSTFIHLYSVFHVSSHSLTSWPLDLLPLMVSYPFLGSDASFYSSSTNTAHSIPPNLLQLMTQICHAPFCLPFAYFLGLGFSIQPLLLFTPGPLEHASNISSNTQQISITHLLVGRGLWWFFTFYASYFVWIFLKQNVTVVLKNNKDSFPPSLWKFHCLSSPYGINYAL